MLGILNRIALQFIAPKAVIRTKYNAFKEMLHHDRLCHQRLAELEELYYQKRKVDLNRIRRLHLELAAGVTAMVGCLDRMAPASYLTLRAYAKKIDFYGRIALTPLKSPVISSFILPLDGSYTDDLQTGGKGLHLCQLKNVLGLPVPEGFIISTSAFHFFMKENNLRSRINSLLSHVDVRSRESLSAAAAQLTAMVEEAEVPERLAKEIGKTAAALAERTGSGLLAVRSSAVGEDSAISFAGQYESILGVDQDRLLAAYKQVLAAKYSAKAIYYRINAGFIDEDTPMAVLVLKMIEAGLSGVVTSRGASSGSVEEEVVIHYTEGLGDKLVGGRCTPATLVVRPDTDGFTVAETRPGGGTAGSSGPASPECPGGKSSVRIAEKLALQLASWARRIELFFQTPQEIEWSSDRRGGLFLLQARSMLIQEKIVEAEPLDISGFPVLVAGGETASRGAVCGPVYTIVHEGQLSDVPDGAVLVTAVTPPSYVLALDRVRAVVAEQGSAADHFASVARESGIPVLVKTGNAATVLAAGRVVTVCADMGRVFDGCIESILERYPPQQMGEQDTSVHRAFSRASQFIFPLQLVDPGKSSFAPENCRSLHDIIRFVHEKGVQTMFSQTSTMFSKRSATTRLDASIPLQIYLLDLNAEMDRMSGGAKLSEKDLRSAPLKALLAGLTHPGIKWRHHEHFDWKHFSELTMGGGIVSSSDSAFASYAVVSDDYLNLNMRFGYHFVILDSLCGSVVEENYIKLRFAGGGGDSAGISLRLAFIAEILNRLGFSVTTEGDLLDAQVLRYNQQTILQKLDVTGRLLAATTLMDMVIKDVNMVNRMVEVFMNGNYDFSQAEDS
ncbi:MAG: PEP/pyruvate-binding domain-containing protein [Desulfobulbaceae bacterium]|nr:PEP/pyruvate-binding domain-containing protein [Desulfobulbaceae bacterium]